MKMTRSNTTTGVKRKGCVTIQVKWDKFCEDKELHEKLVARILEDYNKLNCPEEIDVCFECPYFPLGTTLCHPLYHLWKAVRTVHGAKGKVNALNFPKYDLLTLKSMELNTLEGFHLVKAPIHNKKVNTDWNNGNDNYTWGCFFVFLVAIVVIIILCCMGGINNLNRTSTYRYNYDYDRHYPTHPVKHGH